MSISHEKMEEIYNMLKTPYKFGAIIKDDEYWTDSPTVFRYNGKWYMFFIKIHKNYEQSGYETHLSSSDDLFHWRYEGKVFERSDSSAWDSKQIAGYAAFMNVDFGRSNELNKVNDKYYISYLGGNLNGYETDPLSTGLAYASSPIKKFTRFDKPILTPHDDDAREYEKVTLYKSNFFIDEAMTLGHKYVNVYNGKAKDTKERIFLAVSDDGENWTRYLDRAIIDETGTDENLLITGDPQITKIGELYVMFYFRHFKKGIGTHNTFAVSENLIDWTLWQGEPLIKSEYEWENDLAHKSWVIKHNGVVYHFYCASNTDGERFIALATSKKFNEFHC